jgi:hypothetical protein
MGGSRCTIVNWLFGLTVVSMILGAIFSRTISVILHWAIDAEHHANDDVRSSWVSFIVGVAERTLMTICVAIHVGNVLPASVAWMALKNGGWQRGNLEHSAGSLLMDRSRS